MIVSGSVWPFPFKAGVNWVPGIEFAVFVWSKSAESYPSMHLAGSPRKEVFAILLPDTPGWTHQRDCFTELDASRAQRLGLLSRSLRNLINV